MGLEIVEFEIDPSQTSNVSKNVALGHCCAVFPWVCTYPTKQNTDVNVRTHRNSCVACNFAITDFSKLNVSTSYAELCTANSTVQQAKVQHVAGKHALPARMLRTKVTETMHIERFRNEFHNET